MTYAAIRDAVVNVLFGVEGVKAVLPYAPTAVHDAPLVYVLFDSASIESQGPLRKWRYRLSANLVVRWQDNERAEEQISPLIDAIPAAVAADPQLGGALSAGLAQVTEIESGDLVTIGNVDYRMIRFIIEVVSKEV